MIEKRRCWIQDILSLLFEFMCMNTKVWKQGKGSMPAGSGEGKAVRRSFVRVLLSFPYLTLFHRLYILLEFWFSHIASVSNCSCCFLLRGNLNTKDQYSFSRHFPMAKRNSRSFLLEFLFGWKMRYLRAAGKDRDFRTFPQAGLLLPNLPLSLLQHKVSLIPPGTPSVCMCPRSP